MIELRHERTPPEGKCRSLEYLAGFSDGLMCLKRMVMYSDDVVKETRNHWNKKTFIQMINAVLRRKLLVRTCDTAMFTPAIDKKRAFHINEIPIEEYEKIVERYKSKERERLKKIQAENKEAALKKAGYRHLKPLRIKKNIFEYAEWGVVADINEYFIEGESGEVEVVTIPEDIVGNEEEVAEYLEGFGLEREEIADDGCDEFFVDEELSDPDEEEESDESNES